MFDKISELTESEMDSVASELTFEYGQPIVLDSSEYVLFPIETVSKKGKRYVSYNSKSKWNARYWNVVFYNEITKETRLLTENKMCINQIYPNANKTRMQKKYFTNKILYEVKTVDFNGDGVINYEDPSFLFSSANNGEHFQAISPLNETLQYFEVLPKSEQILLKTVRDSNGDKLFDEKDESIWYNVTWLNNQWKIDEVMDEQLRKKIAKIHLMNIE